MMSWMQDNNLILTGPLGRELTGHRSPHLIMMSWMQDNNLILTGPLGRELTGHRYLRNSNEIHDIRKW